VEELLFRLFLQGWLEVLLTQLQTPFARGFAIVAVSILFAFAHAGSTGVINERVLLYLFVTMTIANLMVFALGIIYLSYVRNVQVIRCFFGTKPFLRPEFPVIVVLCLAALVPIYGLSYGLDLYYPDVNTDPIPIFLFSLLLGALYSFTRNLSYCILLHAVLNVTSLTILWFTV
jgi:membrane protease YdiL (CAAX protease family)